MGSKMLYITWGNDIQNMENKMLYRIRDYFIQNMEN